MLKKVPSTVFILIKTQYLLVINTEISAITLYSRLLGTTGWIGKKNNSMQHKSAIYITQHYHKIDNFITIVTEIHKGPKQ